MSKYDNIDIGASVFTYRFPPGTKLAKKGDTLDTKVGKVLIIESNEEDGYIKAMLLEPISVEDRLKEYSKEIDEAIYNVASIIYSTTATGLFTNIAWELLPSKEKVKYTEISEAVFKYLNDSELLILDLAYLDK